jgi:drug/metabolite transporter (DMT)-like permease
MPRWVFWTLLTLLSWGWWTAIGKRIGDSISPAQSQVLSTLGIVPVIAALAWRQAAVWRNDRRGLLLAFAAGIISCAGNIPFYHLLNRGPSAAAVVSLTALAPLVTVLLAVPVLGERLNRIQVAGIALSLVAIYLFNIPSDDNQEQPLVADWLLLALAPIGLWGLTGLLQKMSTRYISGETAALCFLFAFVPMAGLILLNESLPETITSQTWWLTAALGFTLALGNYTVLLAFASGGKASIVAPLSNLYPVVSIPIAIFWLEEQVGGREWLAIGLALLAVVTLSYETPTAPDNATPQVGTPT